ncbi:MAG: SpoIIE family protein phosphatase [Bacteroidia bacterium]|nr:SpoIIE family protein phosphatase [Bacteroidia bacterium]
MRITIGKKIGLGFGILIFLTFIAFALTVITLTDGKSKTDRVVGRLAPSVAALKELNTMIQQSLSHITQWVFNSSSNDIQFREDLKNIIKNKYPQLKSQLIQISKPWSEQEKKKLKEIFTRLEIIFKMYENDIMILLQTADDYEDLSKAGMARISFEDIQVAIKQLMKELNNLIENKQKQAEEVKSDMFKTFNFLQRFVIILGIMLLAGGVIIALLTTRSITQPVLSLRKTLLLMSRGIIPNEIIIPRKDEIGDMQQALKELIHSLQHTTEFARQTGSGNFNYEYKPLSSDDTLGHALIQMRDNLAQNERLLEQKVIERTEEVMRQKEEIEAKNKELEFLYKQVTDSIHYAKRIQEAILPPPSVLRSVLKKYFVFYRPKDIVSGDFYWVAQKQNISFFATVDCTGHGVPGAFMSLVGYNILRDIILNTSLEKPGDILNYMRDEVKKTLHSAGMESKSKDGMDMTLCRIDFNTLELQYAAAFNPLMIVRNGEIIEGKVNKFPIGVHVLDTQPFDNHVFQLQPNDTLYLFSDGYPDQFGGPKGKKFMIGKFKKLLLEASKMDVEDQKIYFEKTLDNWQGSHDQVDDILVMGIRI